MSIKETITKKTSTLKEKWDNANKKYPWLKGALIAAGVTLVTGGLYYNYQNNKKKELETGTKVEALPFIDQDAEGLDHHHYMSHYAGMITNAGADNTLRMFPAFDYSGEDLKNLWENDYKDNWDELMECVKRMNLKEGEMFCIENRQPYNPSDVPIVSQFMNLNT